MSEEQQFCLRWNNFQVNITSQFEALRDDEDFVDVTLACDGKRLKAHKVVLSACSPYFKDLFKSNPCKHPILFMRDVEFHHLQCLVEFMYAGEVNIAQAQLSAFLRTAESLQIRGLTEAPQRHKQMDGSQGKSGYRRAASPGGGSQAPSPEEADQDGDEEVMSLSPSNSPPPTKRPCLPADKSAPVEQVEESVSNNRTAHSEPFENIKSESIDFVEPKVEAPDYCSDGEGRSDNHTTPQMFQGMENSVDMSHSFAGLQGGMEILPGTSAQNYIADTSQDSGQADQRKLHSLDPRPCPICYRMYSNLSNLRQHLRLIHNPQTVSCPLCSKPFKTKLYLKRHLMSFHELVCTTPKNSAAAVGGPKGPGAPDYYAAQQIMLGKQQTKDDRNGIQNPSSPAKLKGEGSAQDLVAEFFQNRGSYPGSKGNNTGGFAVAKAKALGQNDDRSNIHASSDMPFQSVKDDRTFRVSNQDRFRHSQGNSGSDMSNFHPASNSDNRYNVAAQQQRNVSGDRQFQPQAGTASQDATPAFLNLLSLTKNDENAAYLNPSHTFSGDGEECSETQSVDQEGSSDIAST